MILQRSACIVQRCSQQLISKQGNRTSPSLCFEKSLLRLKYRLLCYSISTTSSSNSSDRLPTLDDDPDIFGSMSVGNAGIPVKDDIGVAASHELSKFAHSIYSPDEADDKLFKPDHRWNMDRLKRTVFNLLRDKKLKEALDTFTEVLQEGGFQFHQGNISFICNALIAECAKVGHVKMAFKLFNDMKKRGATIKPNWYTSLFNACANSPWDSEENLVRIDRLRANMAQKGIEPNRTHFHAMIKAYGRCGAIESAFAVVDDMRASDNLEIKISAETFNFLLQACISDRMKGFRHAVVTWEKMMIMKIKPNIYSYNLFLRAIRECSIQLPKNLKQLPSARRSDKNEDISTVSNKFPEILSPFPGKLKENIGIVEIISLEENNRLRVESQARFPLIQQRTNAELQALLNFPENRLAILGGLRAFTTQLEIHKIAPDLKTVTELVQIVSPTEITDIMMILEAHNLKPDIHFFNMVMKKYVRWNQKKNARETIGILGRYHLNPNIMTWGILALAADTWIDAVKLLKEMDVLGITPNEHIMGGFLVNACRAYDPRYIVHLLEEHVCRKLKPDEVFVDRIEKFQSDVHKAMLDVECGREVRPRRLEAIVQTEEFNEYWMKLKLRLKTWLKEVGGVTKQEIPWGKDYDERLQRLKAKKYDIE